jgi:hypothetical protein
LNPLPREQTSCAIDSRECSICFKDYWIPTPRNINALPEPLRAYIHDLKTVCDPAGDVTELVRLQTENRMLQWECELLAAPTRAKLSRISIRQKEKYGRVSTLSGRLDFSRQWAGGTMAIYRRISSGENAAS